MEKVSKRELNRRNKEKEFLEFVDTLHEYELVNSGEFKYLNAHQKVKMRHIKCGKEWDVKIAKFKGEGCRCPEPSCFTEKRVRHLRKSDKFFNFIKNRYELVDKDFVYKSNKQSVKLIHLECGNRLKPQITNLLRGKSRCAYCRETDKKVETLSKLKELFEQISDEFEWLDEKSEFIKSDDRITVLHKKCGKVFEPTVHNFKDAKSRCPNCCNNISRAEKEISDFVKSLGVEVVENSRSIIPPKELDIFVPSHKFAIEFNGLYWHSEDRVGRELHLDKTRNCQAKGVSLMHIFSDEWRDKPEIVKSMIRNKLGKIGNRVYARKTSVVELSNKDGKQFFDNNHLSGGVNAIRTFSLIHDKELVAVMSLRKPFHKKYDGFLEIARFASKIDLVVPGGFQKLLKRAEEYADKEGYCGILTYADLRFGTGTVYGGSSFESLGKTQVDYWYSDGFQRFNRFKFRATRGKSEKTIAEEKGVFKVFGCGSVIYEKSLAA